MANLPVDFMYAPMPPGTPDDEIEARVEGLLARMGKVAPPVDVEAVAAFLGVTVCDLRLDPEDEVLALFEPRQADADHLSLFVRADLGRWQKRYVTAYMLGRLLADHAGVMCSGAMDTARIVDDARGAEGVASRFANALLVPMSMLKEVMGGRTTDDLAQGFDVHPKAIATRVHRLVG